MAFREDAFSVAITPAGEQQPGKEKKEGEHERVLWWQTDKQKFSQGRGRALLLLEMCSVTFRLVTGAAEFYYLYEFTCTKTILYVWIKGEGR